MRLRRRPVQSARVEGCPFCEVVQKHAPARVVYESRTTLAFFPDYPAARGHTLVVPKVHTPDWLSADADTLTAVTLSVAHLGTALQGLLQPEGMNVITSAGAAASQSVGHLHMHIVPRWHGDRIGELWPEDQVTPAAELDALARSVRQRFSASPSD